MPFAIQVSLKEDSTGGVLGSISHDCEGGSEVREVEDRFRQEKGFEDVERGLTSGGPVPREVFLGEVDKGLCDVGVVRNETVVEVYKAKEGSDILDFLGGWPACNSIQLDGIHS